MHSVCAAWTDTPENDRPGGSVRAVRDGRRRIRGIRSGARALSMRSDGAKPQQPAHRDLSRASGGISGAELANASYQGHQVRRPHPPLEATLSTMTAKDANRPTMWCTPTTWTDEDGRYIGETPPWPQIGSYSDRCSLPQLAVERTAKFADDQRLTTPLPGFEEKRCGQRPGRRGSGAATQAGQAALFPRRAGRRSTGRARCRPGTRHVALD